MLNRLSLLLVFLLFSPLSLAEQPCEANLSNLPKPVYFTNIYDAAVSLSSAIKNRHNDDSVPIELKNKFIQFTRQVRNEVSSKLSLSPLEPKLSAQLDHFVTQAEIGLDYNNLPSFSLSTDPVLPDQYIFAFTNNTDGQEGIFSSSNPQCNPIDHSLPSCVDGLKALKQAIEPYKAAYVHCSAQATAQSAARLTVGWQRYLDESRSQTFTDMLLTTWLEKDHLTTDHLVAPIKRQWFFLHPNIVFENVKNAPDGSNLKEALVVEWAGVNWWDKNSSPVGFPFGFSIASLYSDRTTVDDIGHGVMFHLANKYSLGWASHDNGDEGIYITIDLLELFKDKKADWKKYENKINEYSIEFKNK